MSTPPVTVGVVGAGNISGIYLENLPKFGLQVLAVADLLEDRARAQAEKYGVPRGCSVDELLADPAIELVVNLTIPGSHGTIALAALEHGKSVYNEKPLAIERAEAQRLLALAAHQGLLVGCAPDTFLGAGLQTCRKLIDDGLIGEVVGAAASFTSRGPEGWHPDPAFFYQPGAGPLFDMGPYYLTALVALLGPVQRVSGAARISFAERLITSQPRYGTRLTVTTPTHVIGTLEFAAGPLATIVTSFDVHVSEQPRIEIYGSQGTLSVPDPNTFGGPVRLQLAGEKGWREVPLSHSYADNSRGVGPADLAQALRAGHTPRASGALAYHVLDIMHSLLDAAREGRYITLESGVERPAALAPQ